MKGMLKDFYKEQQTMSCSLCFIGGDKMPNLLTNLSRPPTAAQPYNVAQAYRMICHADMGTDLFFSWVSRPTCVWAESWTAASCEH